MQIPSGWQHNDQASPPTISKTFTFDDFKSAWAFMSQSALYAEENTHHPDWANTYNTVSVELTTHDEGRVTEKDTQFAQFMNKIAE
jgi:4a-hydroxytetrahydrobiopterin dehydratase